MKKIYYYLFTLLAVSVAFTACNPLDKSYKELGDLPVPATAPLTITLTTADYGLLPKENYAKTAFYFKTTDDAKTSIPAILASKYPAASEKATVTVTYNAVPTTIKLADSTVANTTLTLVTTPVSDYRFPAYNGNAANNFDDFSATAVLNFLKYRYQTPLPDNSIRVLTYLYFESNVTASTGTLTTDAFLYTTANGWQKIYRVKDAQYTSVNRGNNFAFVSSDAANLPTYFNNFLKADLAVMATAKVGDVIYVNYKYQTSATVSYQRVLPLTFDGTNWTTTPTAVTLAFAKTNGVWVADNTVNYTLTTADMKSIGANQTTVASAAAVANLASFGNYNIQGGATTWTDDQIATSISVFLKTKFPAAVTNQKFVITYAAYNGANVTPKKTFVYNGTAFVYAP